MSNTTVKVTIKNELVLIYGEVTTKLNIVYQSIAKKYFNFMRYVTEEFIKC